MIDSNVPASRSRYGEYAGFVTRLLALVIDLLLLSGFIILVTAVGRFLSDVLPLGQYSLLIIRISTLVINIVGILAYELVLVTLAGQTIGKRIMGVRIVSADGRRVKPGQAVRRLIGWILSLPLLWGFLIALVDDRRRAFDDRLAGTLVVYSWPEPERTYTTPVLSAAINGVRRQARRPKADSQSANKG
jgi:uncharacterized RDD family membrane protein YckC